MDSTVPIPMADRPIDQVQGHWLLARLGKRVLRPGGKELTARLLDAVNVPGAVVVELAPGLGKTAAWILEREPAAYVGVDADLDAVATVARVVGQRGAAVCANAEATGLAAGSADVVVGEAMLTMQGERGKRAIIEEAVRLLRPGGRYGIHELGLAPDDIDPQIADDIRGELARTIRVNARPLTEAEWRTLLEDAGLVVEWAGSAPMSLLEPRRNIADEGLRGTARIVRNVLRDRDARKRVLAMRATFRRHHNSLTGIALVARKP